MNTNNWTADDIEEMDRDGSLIFIIESLYLEENNSSKNEINQNIIKIESLIKSIPETSFSEEKKMNLNTYLIQKRWLLKCKLQRTRK